MNTRLICPPVVLAILAVLAPWAGPAWSQNAKPVYTIEADGLACPFCAYGIEKQLGAIKGVETVETDIKSGTLRIVMRAGAALDEVAAERAVEAAGFTMRGFRREGAEE